MWCGKTSDLACHRAVLSEIPFPSLVMADFNQSQGWNGTCAPFMYIRDCSPTARTAYQNTSRFWLAANSVSLLVLIVSIIRRSRILKERFNTLKLAVILFTLYPPLYVAEQITVISLSCHLSCTRLWALISPRIPFPLISH